MYKRTYWKLKFLLFAVALAIPMSVSLAQAGPGGGTYYANSPAGGTSGTALRKFVDSLPGLGAAGCVQSVPPGTGSCNENTLGQYIPIATPIVGAVGVPADGSDYYEIGVVQYRKRLHSDLPLTTGNAPNAGPAPGTGTLLRGFSDLNPSLGATTAAGAAARANYLGPLIVAKEYKPAYAPGAALPSGRPNGKPVRVKLRNLLPTGANGDLFIPVDLTLMGANLGPNATDRYTQNRATFHLHGGNTPWISDGTPHQWTAPVGEVSTPYTKGVSTRDVPDMAGGAKLAGDGEMNFYWSNQQSNRLMFYHDHTLGITRLNVYAGEAAGYLLYDDTEEGLINNGTLPNAGGNYRWGIPLVIQDKTFVPQNVAVQDTKWTNSKWGTYGDLWFPHVYEPNQDPNSPAGANPFGRWDYGPWFWPPVIIDAAHSALPEPSTTPEGFHDTPLVNGTAYPYITVAPQAYRFRVLNASNDRGLNLSLFYADPTDPLGTEVKMVPAGPNPSFPAGPFPDAPVWPTDGRDGGVPDPTTMGPKIIQIGSEGGFLPYPVVHPNQPISFNYNRRDIVVLNMQEKNLFLGPAERADIIIDFSSVPPGKNIILYNDGPAPTPAFDTRYDYYTGNPDQTAGGGAPSTLRGYGPNTRTIMQFRVAGTPGTPFDLAKLQTNLPLAFKDSQPAPLVPQPTYPVASGGNAVTEQYAKIQDYSITLPLNTLANQAPTPKLPTTIPFRPKAIQELWDPYGRMNATLGIELPFTNNLTQTTIPMGYAEPTTENIVDGQPQIWKITHNGVDTHPVHFHMVNVQVLNRVGWDGAIRPPDDNELGWKETVRMNPLEDIIVGILPKSIIGLPFAVPASTRPIDPSLPAATLINVTDIGNLGLGGSPTVAVAGTLRNVPDGSNAKFPANVLGYDYGQEFVWHCHILGHEENDFMRPMVFSESTAAPPAPSFNPLGIVTDPFYSTIQGGAFGVGQTVPGKTNYVSPYTNTFANKVVLQWNDGAPPTMPSSFVITRAIGAGAAADYATISFLPGFPPIYTDESVDPNTTYNYQVYAFNAFGGVTRTAAIGGPVSVTTGSWNSAASYGVTISASKPPPHVVGTNVQFTGAPNPATPLPASVAYLYRFSLQTGAGAFVVVQDYSPLAYWTMSDTTAVGSYTVKVEAKTSQSGAPVSSSMAYQVVVPPQAPVTTPSPVPGTYNTSPLVINLTAQTPSPPAIIYYTLDGSPVTTASIQYNDSTGAILHPISLTAPTTTISYFAVDVNNIAETPHSDVYNIHELDLTATVLINNGAAVTNSRNVTLTLNAVDPTGVATMQFSNDNVIYTSEEAYATTKAWTLSAGDGFKSVYVRFRDKSLPNGNLYQPFTASITLATAAPVTTASPIAGTYAGPVSVRLIATSPATIYYTTDGTSPTTASTRYTSPISITSTTAPTTIKYFAVDVSGNTEQVQTSAYSITTTGPQGTVKINNSDFYTSTPTVTLNTTSSSAVSMRISNDGATYTPTVPGAFSANKQWILTNGEGLKTVYVQLYDAGTPTAGPGPAPIVATIILGNKDGLIPGTTSYLASALFALQFANGMAIPDELDLVHADVAPFINNKSQPDGKIDVGDVIVILLRQVGIIAGF